MCAPPERGLRGLAVGAAGALPPARGHAGVLGLDEGPVGAVHLVVEAARVAEVVACYEETINYVNYT